MISRWSLNAIRGHGLRGTRPVELQARAHRGRLRRPLGRVSHSSAVDLMRVLVATDAWHPQINGVVRTLTSLARATRDLGVTIEFLSPEGFPSVPLPTYPGLRLALPNRWEIARRVAHVAPDAIHIATEGSIGYMVRGHCLRHGLPFTSAY